MIKISDGCFVAANEISEVKVSTYQTHITVRTKDGIGHAHYPAWGEGVYTALDRLIEQINSELEQR